MNKKVFSIFLTLLLILIITSCKTTDKEVGEEPISVSESTFEIKNNPPEIKDIKILPDDPNISQDLTLFYEFSDLDKDPDKSIIRWYRNDEGVIDFDNFLTIPKMNLNPNDIWYAEVIPYDGKDFGDAVTSNKIIVLKKFPNPNIISGLEISTEIFDFARGIYVQDDYAYIINFNFTNNKGSLNIVDLSDREKLKIICTFGLTGEPTDIVVMDNFAYITCSIFNENTGMYSGKLNVIDITSKESLRIVFTFDSDVRANNIFINGDLVYITYGIVELIEDNKGIYNQLRNSSMKVLNISNKEKPEFIGEFETEKTFNQYLEIYNSNNLIEDIFVKDNYAYITGSDWFPGIGIISIIDISDSINPKLLSTVNILSFEEKYNKKSIDKNGNNTYEYEFEPRGIYVGGDYAYVISNFQDIRNDTYLNDGDLMVLDISDKENPKIMDFINTNQVTTDLIIQDGYAFLTNMVRQYNEDGSVTIKGGGFEVLDISDISEVKSIAKIENLFPAEFLHIQDDFAYVTGYNYMVLIDLYSDEGENNIATSTETTAENTETDKTGEIINVSVPQEIIIDSTNKNGIKFIVPEQGRYKFSIIEGAYTVYEEEQNMGWLTIVSIFINRPLEFEDTEYGPCPINEDTTIGFGDLKATFNEAENTAKGSSVIRNLNQDDYVILVISDSYYQDNSGSIKIKIEKIN